MFKKNEKTLYRKWKWFWKWLRRWNEKGRNDRLKLITNYIIYGLKKEKKINRNTIKWWCWFRLSYIIRENWKSINCLNSIK